MKKQLSLLICLSVLWFGFACETIQAADKTKIVFISGKPSHGPKSHEHRAGNLLLAKRLNESDLGINAVVLPDVGYPKDPAILKDAATIVVFCTGHKGHLLNPHLKEFDALMKKGTGLVMIHWATEAERGEPGKKFLEWMGGFCDLDWSVNPHWIPKFDNFPDHPVANGLTPFSVDDEWYYHMRFTKDMKGVTPILSALPGPETLKRPDGSRSGNPDVRKAVANGEKQHVAWAYDRPDGKGRGFGFTGAHVHANWQNDNFRKVMLNAILWTAHVPVPKEGVSSKTPSDAEINANLDDKSKKKAPKKAAATKPKPASGVKGVIAKTDIQNFHQQDGRKIDSNLIFGLLIKALAKNDSPEIRESLLKGMLLGLEGQRNIASPKGWKQLSATLSNSSSAEVKNLTLQLSQVFGDEKATLLALETLKNKKADPDDRRQALASLLVQKRAELAPILANLLAEETLRIEAIRAYSNIEVKNAPKLLLNHYPKFETEAQRAIIDTMATRKLYAEALFAALEENNIPREAIPAHVSRSLSSLLGEKFSKKYGVKKLSTDKEALISKYKKLATPKALASADASAGRVVFEKTCMACHKMYGVGGIIGPDLTGSNRADLDYLLLNILDPSGDIPDAYKMVMVTTKNGQFLAGSVTEEDDQKLVLSMVGQKNTIVKSDIKSRQTSPVSMMPEGQMQILKDQEALDLIKYFQTQQQVDLPK